MEAKPWFHSLRWAIASPVQQLVATPFTAYRTLRVQFARSQTLMKENAALRTQQQLIQARLQRLLALQNENKQLRGLLGSTSSVKVSRLLVARLLAVDLHPFVQQILINQGADQGLYLGQAVLDAHGVFGQVIDLAPDESRVLLLTDRRSAIPVQVQRSGWRSVAVGAGDGEYLQLSYVSSTMDVRVGDVLLSSGLGRRYPAGYPVGRIVSVQQPTDHTFKKVVVAPAAHVHRSLQVLLLWPDHHVVAKQSTEVLE